MKTIEIKTVRPWVRGVDRKELVAEGQLIATITVDEAAGENFANSRPLVRTGYARLVDKNVVVSKPRHVLGGNGRPSLISAGTKLFSLEIEPRFESFVNLRMVVDGISNRLFGEFPVDAAPAQVLDS